MATQKRSARSISKRPARAKLRSAVKKVTARPTSRKKAGLKATSSSSRTKRTGTLTAAPRSRKKAIRSRRKSTPRSTGVIGRAIKRGISELAKVGT